MTANTSGPQRKLLLVSLNYAPESTGIAPYVTSIAGLLTERGHDVSVITGIPHYPEWKKRPGYARFTPSTSVADGVSVTRVPHYVPQSGGLIGRILMETTFAFWLLFMRIGRPEAIICTSPSLFAAVALRLRTLFSRRVRLGVWVQDLYGLGSAEIGGVGALLSGIIGALETAVLRRADGVAVIHHRFKTIVDRRVGCDVGFVIRNWSHITVPDEIIDGREELGWPRDASVVLHAGNMGRKQGLDNVVSSAALLDRDGDNSIMFVLMGDGNTRSELEEQAKGVRSIRFMDPLPGDSFPTALRSADLLLVNERVGVKEMAVPSKLTTYFASGTAVVAAVDRSGITAEEIRSTNSGVVVDSGDPQALIDSIRGLMREPRRREAVATCASRHCREHLSRQGAADNFERWISQFARYPEAA